MDPDTGETIELSYQQYLKLTELSPALPTQAFVADVALDGTIKVDLLVNH